MAEEPKNRNGNIIRLFPRKESGIDHSIEAILDELSKFSDFVDYEDSASVKIAPEEYVSNVYANFTLDEVSETLFHDGKFDKSSFDYDQIMKYHLFGTKLMLTVEKDSDININLPHNLVEFFYLALDRMERSKWVSLPCSV